MGLEAVELVIAYEDAFGIEIPNEVAERMRTPGDVVEYAVSQLAVVQQAPCLHSQAFHAIRSTFGARLRLPRTSFGLDARLTELVPVLNRRVVWNDLAHSMGVEPKVQRGKRPWPELGRPVWLRCALFAYFLGVLGGATALLSRSGIPTPAAFWLSVGFASAVLFLAVRLTRPMKRQFPSQVLTLRDLVEYVAASVPQAVVGSRGGWTREQVEWVVRRVTTSVLGITQFSLEDEFVRDLGIS